MNNNILISAGIINTYWDRTHNDSLDLLMPFLKAALAKKTVVGNKINVQEVTDEFRQEIGFDDIPLNTVILMLNRLSPKFIRRDTGHYYLKGSIEEDVQAYEQKRKRFKEQREKVIDALSAHLQITLPRLHFNEKDVEESLYQFFVNNGLALAKEPDKLIGLKQSEGKTAYEIARFIIEESNNNTSVFDYIYEMIKGFFVSTVIYTHQASSSITTAKFKDFCCFLDTRIIINALGMHLPENRKCAEEFLKMLKDIGGHAYCFQHTIDEINDVINAYRKSLLNPRNNTSFNTLEGFDALGYKPSDVDNFQLRLKYKINQLGIKIVDRPPYDHVINNALIDEKALKKLLRDNNGKTTAASAEYDVASASAILRLRNGYTSQEIEKAKYIFISSSNRYCNIANKFIRDSHIGYSSETVPCIMSDFVFSSLLWLKTSTGHKDYPKSKLIENSMIALQPSETFMQSFFEAIDKYKFEGGISADEAALIRSDYFCRRQAVKLSQNDPASISTDTIRNIRDTLANKYNQDGKAEAKQQFELYLKEKEKNEKNLRAAYDKVEKVGTERYDLVHRSLTIITRSILGAILFVLIYCIVMSVLHGEEKYIIYSVFLAIAEMIGMYDMLFSRMKWIDTQTDRIARTCADAAMDKKREEYRFLFDKSDM